MEVSNLDAAKSTLIEVRTFADDNNLDLTTAIRIFELSKIQQNSVMMSGVLQSAKEQIDRANQGNTEETILPTEISPEGNTEETILPTEISPEGNTEETILPTEISPEGNTEETTLPTEISPEGNTEETILPTDTPSVKAKKGKKQVENV